MSSAPTAATYVFGEATLHPFTVGSAVYVVTCENTPLFFLNFARACGWEVINLKTQKPAAVNKLLRAANALIGWATHDISQIFNILYAEAEIPYRPVLIAVGYEAAPENANIDFFAYPESRQIRQVLTSALNMRANFLKTIIHANDQHMQLEAYRQREAELIRTEQELTLFKDVIGSKVAHELGTPMLQVQGAVKELVHADESPIPRETLINYAMQATSRLAGIIKDITMYAEGLEVNLQPMIARNAVDAALNSSNRRIHTALSEGRLQFNLDDSGYIVSGDWRSLAIVLNNLMDNAIKFSASDAPILVSVYQKHGQVYYMIEDHGIGISEEDQEFICDAYYQVEYADNRRFEGAGLGLALVKTILDKHGAELVIQSTLDVGSTFSFSLPLADLS